MANQMDKPFTRVFVKILSFPYNYFVKILCVLEYFEQRISPYEEICEVQSVDVLCESYFFHYNSIT